jgi:hypothetical protein
VRQHGLTPEERRVLRRFCENRWVDVGIWRPRIKISQRMWTWLSDYDRAGASTRKQVREWLRTYIEPSLAALVE